MNYRVCAVGLVGVLVAAVPANAADADRREVCVPMANIQDNNSPAIDDHTIVLELGGHKYKRVDLQNRCPDIVIRGFSYDAPTQELCTSETLHVNEPAGATCLIKDIVDITPAEAKALLRKQ